MRAKPALGLLIRYGVAAAAVGAALALNQFLLGLQHPSALFLAAVVIGAWYGGLGPGLAATILATLALDHFYVPDRTVAGLHPSTGTWLATFVLVAVLISSLETLQQRITAGIRLQNRRQSEFMAVLAHELRNFLSPLSLTVTLLRRRSGGDALIEQACATLERQVRNVNALVNDLLDVARINQGKIVLQPQQVNLVEVLAAAVQSASPLIETRAHQLEVLVPPRPLLLEGDPTRLEQLFVNLLTNAAKYTEPGGQLRVSAEQAGRAIVVRVQDNGKGIPPALLPHIFDLFAQVENGAGGGLGIGLSLVRGIVDLHGGRIEARSPGLGGGSEFVVHLPALAETAGAADRPCDQNCGCPA